MNICIYMTIFGCISDGSLSTKAVCTRTHTHAIGQTAVYQRPEASARVIGTRSQGADLRGAKPPGDSNSQSVQPGSRERERRDVRGNRSVTRVRQRGSLGEGPICPFPGLGSEGSSRRRDLSLAQGRGAAAESSKAFRTCPRMKESGGLIR